MLTTNEPVLKNGQGSFKLCKNNAGFVPGVFALHRDGISYWNMREPFGFLVQYPDGTKRFVKDQVFWDLIELTREEVSFMRQALLN